MAKIGRNERCPCGSGSKFKKCHGAPGAEPSAGQAFQLPPDIRQMMREREGREAQRRAQQGLGRPIVSFVSNGYRIVAVGNRLLWSKTWKTFHDFLFDYIRNLFGGDWGNKELKKPFAQRHPIIQWYHHCCMMQAGHIKEPGKITPMPMIGAAGAYMGLAYNLYLLAHNAEVQKRLIHRLKSPDMFQGAYHEVYVAGAMIRAGFRLELENEKDGSTTHCEFTAIHEPSGRKFSVEAKSRYVQPGETEAGESALRVHNHLYKALKKRALHERIIFVELNVPSLAQGQDNLALLHKARQTVRDKEATLKIDGATPPQAYVFLTNFPYHHLPESAEITCAAMYETFRIEDVRVAEKGVSLRQAIEIRERHKPVSDIIDHVGLDRIPSTFDGEIPELAFHIPDDRHLVIGRTYNFAGEGEEPVIGEVTDASVSEETSEMAISIYNAEKDEAWIMTTMMSEKEMAGYRANRDTYFGVRRRVHPECKTMLDLYDFFLDGYGRTPKTRLLELMADWPNVDALRGLGRKELVSIYAERLAESAYRMQHNAA